MIRRRLVVVMIGTAASLVAGPVAHAQVDESATPTTLDVQTTQVTEETTDTQITVESRELDTADDDDDGDNTGLWGLLGLLGLVGLAGLGGRKRRDAVAVGTPPVGPAAPRTAEGATGGHDYDR